MEKKWTPGPWHVNKDRHHKNWLCDDYGPIYLTLSNAHLIAAAPDLYEALEAAEESIATFIGVHGYPMDSGAGDVLRQVSAALAKARGE